MKDLKFIIEMGELGSLVCNNCGPRRNCGLAYGDCNRLMEATELLEEYKKGLLKILKHKITELYE